jgi:formylglycine-generating enzyme required for sulfatase activity
VLQKVLALATMSLIFGTAMTPFSLARVRQAPHTTNSANPGSTMSASPLADGSTFRDCSYYCPLMVNLPAGTARLGAPAEAYGEGHDISPVHSYTLQHPLAVGVFDVTVGEYRHFARATHRRTEMGCYYWDEKIRNYLNDVRRYWGHPGFRQSESDPVVCVNEDDARDYIQWLNRVIGSRSGTGPYRMLSEDEWEYAARAGSEALFLWSDQSAGHDHANFGSAECPPCGSKVEGRDRWRFTSPVGAFPANGYGLFDMAGNVWQITSDCVSEGEALHEAGHRATGPCKDGILTNNDDLRIAKGGSWVDTPDYVGLSTRLHVERKNRNVILGFRVAKSEN